MTSNGAAVTKDDVAGDRETEAGASRVSCASLVEPCEAVEDGLTLIERNARTVIIDHELDSIAGLHQ